MPKRLEITPTEIEEKVQRGKEFTTALTLRNRGSETASYELEDEIGIVKAIQPDNVTIAAGASATVALTLMVPSSEAVLNTMQAKIVATNSDDPTDTAEVEIKLKVQIPQSWIVIAVLAVAVIVFLLVIVAGLP